MLFYGYRSSYYTPRYEDKLSYRALFNSSTQPALSEPPGFLSAFKSSVTEKKPVGSDDAQPGVL